MTVAEKKYLEKWTFAEEQVYLFPLNTVFFLLFSYYKSVSTFTAKFLTTDSTNALIYI